MEDARRLSRILSAGRASLYDGPVLGHLSARVPGTTDQFLINPYPRLFEQITAFTLVKVNATGDVLLIGYTYDIPA